VDRARHDRLVRHCQILAVLRPGGGDCWPSLRHSDDPPASTPSVFIAGDPAAPR
jgi:hypothetical protein